MTLDDIDLIVLHQGSRYIVETIAQRLDAVDKVEFYAEQYGNTISSSIPIVLADQIPANARRIVICGFGVGLAWATTVLERT